MDELIMVGVLGTAIIAAIILIAPTKEKPDSEKEQGPTGAPSRYRDAYPLEDIICFRRSELPSNPIIPISPRPHIPISPRPHIPYSEMTQQQKVNYMRKLQEQQGRIMMEGKYKRLVRKSNIKDFLGGRKLRSLTMDELADLTDRSNLDDLLNEEYMKIE
jgi:hypothetical protein